MKTIEAIRAVHWVGNFHSDQATFRAVDEFVQNGANPMVHRAEALFLSCSVGMGLTPKESDPLLPDDYAPGENPEIDAGFVARYMQAVADLTREG